MIKVALITVNYNNASDTVNLLESLKLLKNDGVKLEKYVVDNGSKDNGYKQIKKKFPEITLIKSKTNLGFAGGNNLAIKKALESEADHILLINNDAEITDPQFLNKMISKNKGISAPVVVFKRGGDTVFDYGGRVDKLFGRNTHYESFFPIEDALPKADYYSGVCLMITPKVFDKIGFLDDSFFLYYEDADFCLRAAEAGFKPRLVPDTTINHKLSASANKLGKKKLNILANSQFRFSLKHLPPMSTPFFLAYNVYLRLKS